MSPELLILLVLLVTVACAQLRITSPPSPVEADIGATAVLQCTFTLSVTPVDPAQVHVVWKREGKKVLTYADKITAFRPGALITEEQLALGDASLSLHNVTQEDTGYYSCSIRLASEQATQVTNLMVKDYRHIHVEGTVVVMNRSNELRCSASNLSSSDVMFEWMKNGAVLSTSIPQAIEASNNESYKVQSSFCFTPVPGDNKAHYACQIQQKTYAYPLKKTFQITDGVRPFVSFYLASKTKKNSSLICLVTGFYPDDFSLAIKRGGQVLGYKLHKWLNKNGTYSAEANCPTNILFNDSEVEYTCTVHHPTIPHGETERLTFLVDPYVPKGLWITPLVIFLLIFMLAIFTKQVTEISGDKNWTEGRIAALKCSLKGRYPRTITAVWLVRQRDREFEVKERGSLYTAGNYTELQEQDMYTCWNVVKRTFVGGLCHSICSILCFQVHKDKHNQAEFVCRFMRGGKVLAEKVFSGNVLDNYGFYSASEVCVPETCNEGEKLTLSCEMKGSIPQDIRFTWEKSLNERRTPILKDQEDNYQITENKSQGQMTAFLTFCPSCEDSQTKYTCTFFDSEGRILAERTSKSLKVVEPKKDNWCRTYRDWGFRAFEESVITEM
ncbi:uncharacterized protein [Hyperolius riggenbachi]|uniref:uncharacterized protein n=1 Tax=Hyperolius riggenbachi TaxID=752182 RepID=UPI0035A36BF8